MKKLSKYIGDILLIILIIVILVLIILQGFCVTHLTFHGRNEDTLFTSDSAELNQPVGNACYVIVRDGNRFFFYQESSVNAQLPLLNSLMKTTNQGGYDLSTGETFDAYQGWRGSFGNPFDYITDYLDGYAVYFREPCIIKTGPYKSSSGNQFFYAGVTSNEEVINDERTIFFQELEEDRLWVYFMVGVPIIN